MAHALIPNGTAGMIFYPGGYRATGSRFWRLLALAATAISARDPRRRPHVPEPAQEAGQQEADPTAGAGNDLLAVYARNDHARRVVAGFAAEMPSLSGLWQQVDRALADVPALGAACLRLAAELAAIRAALDARQALPESLGGDDDEA